MKNLTKAALLAATVLSFPLAANADTFEMTNFTVLGAVNVTMDQPVNQTVQAGQIELTGPGGNLLVWCLDLTDTLVKPYTYLINSFTVGSVFPGLGQLSLLDALQLRQIASLMDHGLDPSDSLSRAATQLAIWKVEYGNLFDPTNLSVQLQTDLNGKLLASLVGGALDCPGCTINVLTDAPIEPNQALGFAVDATPLPAAVWLFGGGLGVLGMFARKRKKQKTAWDGLPRVTA